MLSRPFRLLLRYIWESLLIIVAIGGLSVFLFGPGPSGFDQMMPNVFAAAGVFAIIVGGSAAGTIRRGPVVVLRDHIALRQKERFDFAVVGVLLGPLYFGIAASFYATTLGPTALTIAILAPLSAWTADTLRARFVSSAARPPRAAR